MVYGMAFSTTLLSHTPLYCPPPPTHPIPPPLPSPGAVPDGAIVLFAGMAPPDVVQKQLAVGIGTLAGSTIMLLTIPWFLSIMAGRVNIVNGEPRYKRGADGKKLSDENAKGLWSAGVACNPEIQQNGKIMVFTALIYLVIQGPAFASKHVVGEKWYALAGLILCIISLAYYIYLQFTTESTEKTERVQNLRKAMIENGEGCSTSPPDHPLFPS
jgi:hypothetical protein